MTAGEPTKVLEAELPLAPSATWNESWYRIEKIGASGKKLVCGNEPSAPMANLLIAEVERLFAELEGSWEKTNS